MYLKFHKKYILSTFCCITLRPQSIESPRSVWKSSRISSLLPSRCTRRQFPNANRSYSRQYTPLIYFDGFLHEIFAFLRAWRNILFSVIEIHILRNRKKTPWRRVNRDRRGGRVGEREKLLKEGNRQFDGGLQRIPWILNNSRSTHRLMKYSRLKCSLCSADRELSRVLSKILWQIWI